MNERSRLYRTVALLAIASPAGARQLAAAPAVRLLPRRRGERMPHAIDLAGRAADGADRRPPAPAGDRAAGAPFRTVSGGTLSPDGARIEGSVLHAGEAFRPEVE